jgi:hypothetical protein
MLMQISPPLKSHGIWASAWVSELFISSVFVKVHMVVQVLYGVPMLMQISPPLKSHGICASAWVSELFISSVLVKVHMVH